MARPFISCGIIRSGEIGINIKNLNAQYRARAIKGLNAAGLIVQNAARRLVLDGPKTGKVYSRSIHVEHRASAPGEAPASDTGRLVSSIIYSVDEKALMASITAGTIYAKYLEFGTRKMLPRPFLGPALTNNRPKVIAVMRASLSAGGKNAR